MPESFIAWNIEIDRLDGVDPAVTPIRSIAAARFNPTPETFTLSSPLAVEQTESDVFFAHCGMPDDDDHSHSNGIDSETLLLASFDRWLSVSGAGCHHLVGWGTTTFDAPFVHRRSGHVGAQLNLWLHYNPTLTGPATASVFDYPGGTDHQWWGLRSMDLAQEVLSETLYTDIGIEFDLGPVAAHHGYVEDGPPNALTVVRAVAAVTLANGIGDRDSHRTKMPKLN